MAFSDLTADVDLMRAENTIVFTEYSDSQLTALKRDAALQSIKNDLILQMNITSGSTDIYDDIEATYSDILNNALTVKQLEIFYFENSDGFDSQTHARYEKYRTKYNEIKKSFSAFRIDEETTQRFAVRKFSIG